MAKQDRIESPKQDKRLENYPAYGTHADIHGAGEPGESRSTQMEEGYDALAASQGAEGGGNTGEISTRGIGISGPPGRSSQ